MQKLAQIPALKILRVKSISTNFGSEKTPNSKTFGTEEVQNDEFWRVKKRHKM